MILDIFIINLIKLMEEEKKEWEHDLVIMPIGIYFIKIFALKWYLGAGREVGRSCIIMTY